MERYLGVVCGKLEDSQAVRDYADATSTAKSDGRFVTPDKRGARSGRTRRDRGFRPVITTLPEGTNMTATGVVSADRRYVRITATPLFSLIGNVSTFNFQTGMNGMNTGMCGGMMMGMNVGMNVGMMGGMMMGMMFGMM